MARRLLLADDSITIQKVVELVLAEEDFEIRAVSNGEDAINILESFRPEVVLADIEMPKVNGYQLCERIKKDPAMKQVPVILLAGAFEPIDEELASKVGADDSVIKPFESQELISKINAVFALSSAGADEFEVVAEAGDLADEELLELTEEAADTAAPVSSAEAEVNLWPMEEVIETDTASVAEGELAEEAGSEEFFELEEEVTAAQPVAEFTGLKETPQVAREVIKPEVAAPSKEEFLSAFEKTVDERISAVLSSLDMREAVLAALMPALKESVDKVLWAVAPELTEKVLREVLKGSVSSVTAQIEKVIWETVPDLAGTMISKEIDKIKAEF